VNFPTSGSATTDPFATPTTYNPFATPQVSYEEKAQHIKAAFAPPLQPTSPSITAAASSQYSYPKPNYNVSFNPTPQPNQSLPTAATGSGGVGVGGQFGVPNPSSPYPAAPAAYNQFNLQQQPYNSNPFNAPPATASYGGTQQPQSSNPFF